MCLCVHVHSKNSTSYGFKIEFFKKHAIKFLTHSEEYILAPFLPCPAMAIKKKASDTLALISHYSATYYVTMESYYHLKHVILRSK